MKPCACAIVASSLAAVSVLLSSPIAAQTYRAHRPARIGFGGAAAIAGDQVLIGRPGTLIGFPLPASHAGAVHMFRKARGQRGVNRNGEPQGRAAGRRVRVGPGRGRQPLAIGAPGAEGGGAVYVYERDRRHLDRAGAAHRLRRRRGRPFGAAVALKGAVLLAGRRAATASGERSSSSAGAGAPREWTPGRDPGRRHRRERLVRRGAGLRRRARGDRRPGRLDRSIPPSWKPGQAFVFRPGPPGRLGGGGPARPQRRTAPRARRVGAPRRGGGPRRGAARPTAWRVRWSASGARAQHGWPRDGRSESFVTGPPASVPRSLATGAICSSERPRRTRAPARSTCSARTGGDWKQVQQLVTPPAGIATRLGAAVAGEQGYRRRRRAAGLFLRGNRAALPAGWRRRGMAGGRGGERHRLQPCCPAVAGGEVKCEGGKARAFDCRDADLVAFLPKSAIGAKRGTLLNDIWGWTDSTTGREFAIVGRTDGTSFVEVTDPANPKYLGDLPMHQGARANIWRDMKVYKNHAFIVADGSGPHGMQVFDLTQLRNVTTPQTFQETAHYDADRQRPQHRDQSQHRVRLPGREQHGRQHLRRRAPHDRRPRAGQAEVRRLLRRPRPRSAAHRIHPRRPVRHLSRSRRPRYHGREICLNSVGDRARHRRRHRQERSRRP